MNYIDFSTRIKKKYPQYGGMDDRELAQRIVAKYPQYDVSFEEEEATGEEAFQNWYNKASKEFNLDPNPDAPEHFYDYRSAFKAGAWPDETGHWPSEYKLEGHPRMVIDGVNTKTGERHIDASFQSETPDVVSTPALQGKQPSTSIAPYQGKKPQEMFAGTEDPFTQPEQKEEYKGNIFKDTYGSLEAGVANLASGIAKIPGALLDTYLTATNRFNKTINKATGANLKTDYKTPDIVYENGLTRFLEEDAKRHSLVTKKYQEKGEDLVSVISKGKVTDIAEYLYHSVLEQAPQLMGIAVAQMAGVPAWGTIGTLGGSSGAQKIDEIRKKVDSGELNTEKEVAILSGWINGLAEAGFEKMGSFKILEKLTSALKGAPKTVVANTLKNTFKGLLTGFAEEAKEEMATSITQNVVDYISGVNPDLTWEDIVREAFEEGTIGGLSGGVPGMAGGFAEGVSSRRIREGQTAQSQQAKTVRDNIRNVSEKEAAKTQHVPQREVEEGDTKKEPDRIYKEIPPSQPVLKSVVEKTKPENVPPSGEPQTLADKGITEQQFFELPDEERHKVFRDLSEEEQDYLLQWDGETEREIAETIDRIKRSAEEQKEIDKIETEPSEAQKEAGNYPKAHIKRDGLDISIENAAGSERSGKDETGKEWKQTINHDYGYVKGTKGPDKDHVDVFIKPGSSEGGTVYVVNQVNPNTQKFDEPKCMMGFESEAEAKEAYLSNYEENWQGLGSITPMSMDVFKKWVYSKDAKKKSPVTVADLKKYEQVKPEPKKEPTAKKTETIQKEGFGQPSPEYSEDVIPKEDVPVIQIRKDEDKKLQQKMPGQGRKDMENRLGNIIGYSIIVADEKDLKESGTKEPLSQRDKRRERSYEDGKAVAKKLIEEIEGRNYAELVDRLSVLENKGSRAAFTAYTGIKLPKTVSGTKSVIRTFVGKDVYNKHLESIKKKKEEAAQKQKQKAIEERNERLKEEKVTDNGRLTNNFDLIHRLVEDEGYTRLEEEKKGIATHYLIHNDEKERYYRFRKKDHGDLIKELLEKQFGEVEITPPGVKVATKKDLDHLFGKDLKPEEKEKGTNKPADQNVVSLKQEEFNAKENTKENQADTKAIKETGRSVRTVTSTRGGSHPRRPAAVKRSQPDESYSVEYWQAQHLHNLNVSLYNALRFGWKDRKGKSHPGMQPGWINDFNILTDSNILGGRRGKNLSSNAQSYLQDLVDSFNESPEYLAELASLGLEQPEHIDDIRMWLEQSLSASEFVEYHKGYEADLVPQTDMNKFNEALEVFQEDHTKLTPEQRRVLEESWQMDLDDVIARENALQEQSGSAIDEMWGEEKAEDLFEGTELVGPVTRSETSTKKKPQYETGDLFEGTALQETELGKELVRRREKKDKIKERGAEGLPLFETPDESNQTSLFEQRKESSEKYVQESAKIEDFGEKIGGARKDYYADFVSNLNSAVSHDIADVPLSKSWPQPDYNKLLDEGKDKWAVAFFRAARDEIGTKPQRSYRIKSWAEKVRFLRDFATQVLNGDISKESLLEHLNQAKFSDLAKHLLGRIELYETFGHDKSLKGIHLTKNHYSLYKGQKNVDKWLVEKDAKATAFGNMPRTLGEGDTKQEAIESFRKSYDSLGEGKSSATKFVAYTKRGAEGVYIGVKIGKNYVDLKKFDTSKEALEYKKGNTGELQALLDKYKDIPSERREFNRERIGKDHRGGADATPEMFDNVFGFRGVEFGNWVKDSERQENLNQAYDALMDLSTILNIPSRAISLNGELGLAFGSRGRGGKGAPSAHYEPSKIVINLTKKNGPGSLAHEWWHALDNYLSRKKGRKDDFQTVSSHVPGNVPLRPELAAAVGNVVEAIKKTGIKKRSENLDRRRSTPYWSTTIEMTARAFENYVINKLADLNVTNDYLANVATNKEYSDEIVDVVLSGETPRAEDMYPYILPEEMGGVIEGFDNLFNTIKTKVEDSGDVAFYAKSDQVTKWPVDTSGKKVDPTQLEEYDFDEPLTHESGSDFDGIINKEGIFNGVFTLEGLKGNALGSGGYHHTYIPRKDSVAREGSIDLDEERALDFIKNEYPDATQEQLEVIEAVAVRDKPLLDVVEDEYGEEDVVGFFNNLIYGDNAGETEWVLQGLRGQIALDQGFDAIAMRDENGTSYLIPAGSKALYLGKVNSYDDLEKIKNSAENTKGASFAKSDQTKTKEFKKWFGDWENDPDNASKVVDKKGNPLVVYHGSPDARFLKDEAVFKSQKERYGMGHERGAHWFASSQKTARTYSDPWRAFDYQKAEPRVIGAYLNMRNPLVIDGHGKGWREVQKLGKTSNVIELAQSEGHDGIIIRNVKDNYTNTAKTVPTDTYVVFDSNQIKSATENIGTFDPQNPDIRYARSTPSEVTLISDQTKTKEFKKWSGESPVIKIGQASHYKFKSGNPVVVEALHGSDKVFSVFEDLKLGANTGAKSAQKGHFFTDNPDVAEIYPAYSKDMIMDELRQTILPKKEFVPINVDYSKAEIDVHEIKGEKRAKIKIPYKDKEGYFEKFSGNPKYNDMSDEEILKDMVEGVKKANYGRSVEVEPAKFDTEKLMEEQKEIEKKLDREYGDYIEDTLNLSVDYLRENKGKDRELFNNKNMPYKVRRGINDLLSKYDKNAADIEMLRKMLYKHDYSKRKHAGSYGDEVWEATDTDLRPNVSKVFIRLKNPLVYDYKGSGYRDVSYSELVDKAKAEERDGLILLNTADPYESNIFVALKSTSGQIKSATGNIGTFDPQNPDIRYAQSTPSEVTLIDEPVTSDQTSYSSTTEERLTTSIFRSEGKDPIPGSIRVVEDVGKGVQKDVTAFVEDVTGKKVVWVECDTGTLVDSLGFSIDGVSFPKSIHPDLANKIFIDVNTTRPVLWTAFHEFSHFLENSPEFKKKFWEVAKLTDSGLAQRAKMGDSEFSADIVGEMMSREEFWENLKNHDRNLFDKAIKKIIEILSRLSRSLKRMLTGNEITEESRPAFERFIENSTELRNELAKALIDYNKAKGENVKETSNRLAAAVKSFSNIYYSPLLRAVENLKQHKGTGDQMFNMITKAPGVKEAEWKWIGLDDFLKGKKSVTRGEIEEFVRSNEVRVEEVEKGKKYRPVSGKKTYVWSDVSGNYLIEAGNYDEAESIAAETNGISVEELREADETNLDEVKDIEKFVEEYGDVEPVNSDFFASDPTKYTEYQLPGAENYREVLMTLPSDLPESSYKSSHWDEPNVFAHTRLNDRTGPNGEKVLFVEEIQSDWEREAREKGVKGQSKLHAKLILHIPFGGIPWDPGPVIPLKEDSPKTIDIHYKSISDARDGYDKLVWSVGQFDKDLKSHNISFEDGYITYNKFPIYSSRKWEVHADDTKITEVPYSEQGGIVNNLNTAATAKEALRLKPESGVPNQPFLKNWHELVLKRILRMASEEGYDRVAWITGKETADRYDLSKEVEGVMYTPEKNLLEVYDKRGYEVLSKVAPKEKVADYIGKEPAERLFKTEVDDLGAHVISGEDLKIGGEWATNLYDRMIPKFFSKYGKKWDTKVDPVELKGIGTHLSIPVTKEMKDAVLFSGQPLFAKKKPKEEFTERVSEAEKLERMTQKLRGKLRHLPKDKLKERAQIELSIQSAQAQELWHIKNAIYDYAKRIGLKGVPYNKVDTLLKNTETVSQLKKVSETLDDVWNSHVKRSAVEKLLNVIEKEYTRLKAIRGKRVSTIDRDKNRELEAYLAGLMAEPDPEAMARLNDTMEYFLSYAPKEIRKNPNWREQFKGKNLSEKHLAEITEWIEGRGTFPVFLSKDIQKAFRSNIYAMDTEQVERTIKDIEEIKKEGRTARKEKIARETMVREANISSIVSSMGHEEDMRPQNLKNKDRRERKRIAEGIKRFGDNVLFENLRIERILNWLDGNNGLLWKSVFEPILKAEENEKVNLEKALAKFEEFHKKIDTKEALSEVIGEIEVSYEVEPGKFKSEKMKITADHGMFIYANSQNPGNLEHLEGTGYTKEHIAQITEALPEKYKNAVDDLITYFDEEQYPRTNVHFAEEHEVDMPKVHRYFPVRNLASERSANAAATSDILMRYGLNRASVKKGHTKTRVMSKVPFGNESYFETALQSIIDAEHYIAFNTPVREVSRYIYDPRIKDAIKEKSSAAYREIRKWIRDSSHGRIAPPETSLDNVANYIRNNYAVAVLGANLITIMKQPASFSQGLHHIKKKKYAVKAAVDFLVETLKMASKVRNIKDLNNLENSLGKKVQEKSVMMRYRPKSVERYYAEQLEKGRFKKTLKIEGGWEKLREVMMSGIQAADMATTTVLWWGRYTEVLNNTMDEYVAIQAADELIRTTQPMGGLIHLPGSFRDPSAFKRAFSMFMNQRNQNFNMLFETATQWQSHGWSENAQRIVFYILVPSVLMFAASTGGKLPWDDPEGWAEYLLDIITGGIMYYNTLASAATKGATNIIRSLRGKRKDRFFNDFSNPVIDVVQDFNSLLANPNNVGRWIETGGKLIGFPAVTQTKRAVKSFKSAVESKDPKKLVWSDYALGENGIYDAMAWRLHKATKPEEKKIYAKWYKSLSPKKQEQFKEYSVRWRKKNK